MHLFLVQDQGGTKRWRLGEVDENDKKYIFLQILFKVRFLSVKHVRPQIRIQERIQRAGAEKSNSTCAIKTWGAIVFIVYYLPFALYR